MEHITQRRKPRSSSLPLNSNPSPIKNDIWFLDIDQQNNEDNNSQEEIQSPAMTSGNTVHHPIETTRTNCPFTTEQLTFIQNLLNKQKQDMSNEIENLRRELKTKDDQLVQIEKDVIDMQQYIRRNNIEIHGIPDTVEQKDLEKKVIEVCSALNVHVKKQDIEACHRLEDKTKGKSPKKTIVRFVNRNFCDDLHRNKKMLKDGGNRNVRRKFHGMGLDHSKTYLNNNLCPYNKFLWGKCKQLHSAKLIDKFWVYNGHIFINDNPNESKGTKVNHFNELKQSFPGFDFQTKFT